MFFYVSIVTFVALLVLLLYRFRAHIPPVIAARFRPLNGYTQLSTWADQANHGLSSNAFDIETNVRDGDSRLGLDEEGTREVLEIMRRQRVGFDQARLIRHHQILAKNGIDPSGLPLDSKAVTHL